MAIVSVSPLTAFAELVLTTSAAMIFPATTCDVRMRCSLRLFSGFSSVVERSCGQLREGLVGRREYGEGPGSFQCLDEVGRLERLRSVLNDPAATAVSTMSLRLCVPRRWSGAIADISVMQCADCDYELIIVTAS